MTSKYTGEYTGALQDVAAAGAAVIFRGTGPSTYNEVTEVGAAGTPTSVTGKAIKSRSSYKRHEALKLVITATLTLFFVPDTINTLPTHKMTVEWAGENWTVEDVDPVAPDGIAIAARIIIGK